MIILQPSVRLADPHICSDAKNRLTIFNAIFDALVRRDATGRFIPALATEWQLAADARTWTFKLRSDVLFHNGDPLTAADVVASLQRACDPAVGGELGTEGVWAGYIGDAEMSAPDETTVNIVTSRPMADLLDLLVAIPIMPANTLSLVPTALVGTGPYELTERSRQELLLVPFEQAVVRQPRFKEKVIFRAEPDMGRRITTLQMGEADLITNLDRAGSQRVAGNGKATLEHVSNLCVAFLCNLQQGPCTDKPFRQALNYATNIEAMIERCHAGGAEPLNGPLTHLHFGCDRDLPPYRYDPEKAKALLATSSAPKKVTIDLPTTLPDEAPILGEMLKADLEAVGIEVELQFHEDRPAYAHMVKRKEIADICCFDSSPLSTYRVLREKMNSDVAGPWWQGYANPAVNQLLDKAAETIDDDAREAVYQEAYRLMHDDAPWIFLYRPTLYFGANRAIADQITIGIGGLPQL